MDKDYWDLTDKPQTRTKLNILSDYLNAWAKIFVNQRKCKKLYYVDCFAGRGKYHYKDQKNAIDGSPLIGINVAKEIKTKYGREMSCFFIEDYIWHKKNAFPGKWPNRFRDAWEHCLHFTKDKDFKMYQEAVKVPIGDWADTRLKKLGPKDKIRSMSRTDSGFGRQLTNWVGKRKVYPSNVLHLPTISANKNHCAVFPEALPMWFIKLFTRKGDVVLDPFIGSGTTAVAALKSERNYIGIDLSKKYCAISKKAIKRAKSNLI